MRYLKEAGVLLVASALSLALCELAARQFGLTQKIKSGWGWERSPMRGAQPPSASNEVNGLGLRGQEFIYGDRDYVVLLVGDSQVEAANSAKKDLPEMLLQQALTDKLGRPIKVFSLAASGWSQDQELLALQDYFKQHRADLVVVWATPGNDFWENTFPDRSTRMEAGQIKPTFLLKDGALDGPYYREDFFIYHSAFVQAAIGALYRETIQDFLLTRWRKALPRAAATSTQESCDGTVEVDLATYYSGLFDLDHSKPYTITTDQDVEHSRGAFAPLTQPETDLDRYQKALAKALFGEMARVANANKAQFKVFYPLREDFDNRWLSARCVKTASHNYFRYTGDFAGLLKQVVPAENLLLFPIDGTHEIVVSKIDRHLNPLGNERTMRKLAELLPIH